MVNDSINYFLINVMLMSHHPSVVFFVLSLVLPCACLNQVLFSLVQETAMN